MSDYTGDVLRDLIRSTLAFYERFGVTPQVNPATRVFEEEVHELIEAARAGTDKDHIAEEAADVFVTVIGLCTAAGVSPDRLIQQIRAVIAKNDAKTNQTHAINEHGKIARRESEAKS